MPNQDTSVNNTPYNDDELNYFKQLLEQEKQETQEEIDGLQNSLESIQSNQKDENSAAAHHQGDIASEEDEREKILIMQEKEKNKMNEITAAFDRIELGTYGVCEDTGQKIKKGRLEAIPYTRFSLDAQKTEEG